MQVTGPTPKLLMQRSAVGFRIGISNKFSSGDIQLV